MRFQDSLGLDQQRIHGIRMAPFCERGAKPAIERRQVSGCGRPLTEDLFPRGDGRLRRKEGVRRLGSLEEQARPLRWRGLRSERAEQLHPELWIGLSRDLLHFPQQDRIAGAGFEGQTPGHRGSGLIQEPLRRDFRRPQTETHALGRLSGGDRSSTRSRSSQSTRSFQRSSAERAWARRWASSALCGGPVSSHASRSRSAAPASEGCNSASIRSVS